MRVPIAETINAGQAALPFAFQRGGGRLDETH